MIHPKLITIAAAIVVSLAAASPAHALKELQGREANEHVGNAKERFAGSGGGYTYEILKRKYRDAMNARASDALIFTKKTNKFYYRERRDGQYTIILGHAQGREEDPVTSDAVVWNPIANALSDDHPDAHVYLDDAGEELAVVYTGPRTDVDVRPSSEGILEIRIIVRSNSANRGKSRY